MVISLGFSIGCSKDNPVKSDCIEAMLNENNMTAYDGQEIECEFFLELYHYDDRQFFLLGSHCADIISYPTDCEGNKLCENSESAICKKFYNNSERIGIVGIGE